MKNSIRIFTRDLKGLVTNFLALVVAGGLCFLPALYAWFNIYANWDPYANTGNIKIAVVNLDEGYTDDEGTSTNMGDNIEESLREKDSINWVFLDTEEEALDGVKSGDYYAALVIDADFSYGMYNGVLDSVDSPKITYYVNDKKNAVATKITDSAASSVKASVNKSYIEVLVSKLFTETNALSEDLSDEDAVSNFITKLETISENLGTYDAMIQSFIDGNESMSSIADNTSDSCLAGQDKIENGIDRLDDAKSHLTTTQGSFDTFSGKINTSLNQIESSLSQISTQLSEADVAAAGDQIEEDLKQIATDAQTLSDSLNDLSDELDSVSTDLSSDAIDSIQSTIKVMGTMTETFVNATESVDGTEVAQTAVDTMQEYLSNYKTTVESLQTMYNNQIAPQVGDLLNSMQTTLTSMQDMLDSLSQATGTMSQVFTGVGTTLDALNMSMTELQGIFTSAKTKIDSTLEKLQSASTEEQVDIILNLMAGDPETLGSFFSEPVQVEDHYIYEIENYGSGVAPFYTTLAIWVGMTILVSLIKVHAEPGELVGVTPTQLYLGRFLTFLLLSQIQTAIIVFGDLFILKIQCLYPLTFWAVAAMTSLTFALLVYSLTIAFGDIGKALAVVIMVIQIAGSGGTYPIEALPSFFRAVYIFFPFPYAINAMRECIGGMYENQLTIYMLELGLFCLAALAIGLFVRIPFIRVNHFIEERMEDTEMM